MTAKHDRSSEKTKVAIYGHGLSAYSCAAVLDHLGIACDLFTPEIPPSVGPPLVLNDVCLDLLDALFPQMQWFKTSGHLLHARYVSWGQAPLHQVPITALTMSTGALLKILRTQLEYARFVRCIPVNSGSTEDFLSSPERDQYEFIVNAGGIRDLSGLSLKNPKRYVLGRRKMLCLDVDVDRNLDTASTYIESLPSGWFFLAPSKNGQWRLQAMLIPEEESGEILEEQFKTLCVQSRVIFPKIKKIHLVHEFPGAPYLNLAVAEKIEASATYFATGESAVKLDPISGEGTPFAIRNSILVGACISAILKERTTSKSVLSHYRDRLALSFLSHVQGCLKFYTDAFIQHPLWRTEMETMQLGIEQLQSLYNKQPGDLSFQLTGYELQAI